MSTSPSNCENDLLRRPLTLWLLWVAPWVLIIATGMFGDNLARTTGWTFGFAAMGVACLVNARGCGRRHCFYTGPLFLLAALASLLYGLQVLPLGRNGWNWIADGAAVGALLACFGLERLLGKYGSGHSAGA